MQLTEASKRKGEKQKEGTHSKHGLKNSWSAKAQANEQVVNKPGKIEKS